MATTFTSRRNPAGRGRNMITVFLAFVLATWSPFVAAFTQSSRHLTVKGQPFPSLLDATIEDLQLGLAAGLFTSVDLVDAYLARIDEVNGRLNVVTEINPDARLIARQLDLERASGVVRGPLHGLPILIKNNIATADRMNNTAGSLALLGAKVPVDATVAAKLRTAGAILLGKANLSQWANFRSSNSSNGWSAHGGQTIAAYHSSLRQDPSGSSSGSGVAASLGLAAATLGTETDGSILSPAGRNNIVGIKPTVGLTSRFLVIPISEHQDTVGPMARTVKDAAYVLQAIAGPDIRGDNYTSQVRLPLPNYVAACRDDALEGARIGVPRNVIPFFGNDSTTLEELVAFDRALADMQGAGATIVDPADFTQAEALAVSDAESDVLRADFISNLASYLSELTVNPTGVRSLADVRRFTQQAAGEMFPDRNTDTWDEALGKTVVDDVTGTATQIGGFNNTDPRFWAALQQNLNLGGEGGLLGALERNRLDAIVLPTTMAPHWAAIIGAPAISVPLGAYGDRQETVANRRGDLVDTGPGIPFGISFLGRRFDEARLIGLAHAFEQRSRVRETVLPKIAIDAEIRDFAGL